MFQAPLVSAPIVKQTYNNTLPELWELVIQKWRINDYRNTIYQLLNFLGIQAEEGQSGFIIPHGSINIHVELQDEQLKIYAPFLDLTGSIRLPLFRQALQINHEPLRLNRIQLSNEQLMFYFESPYPLCDPYKIFDVLKEICIHADMYDDTFIRKYRAKRIAEPQIYPLPEHLRKECTDVFRKIIADTEESLRVLVRDRMHEFLWDNFVLMLLKIDFMLAPNGHLKSDIEKGIVDLHSDIELSEKINIGKKLLHTFKNLPDHQIAEDLYRIETFVPLKELISHESFKNQLQQIVLQIQRENQKGDYVAAYFTTVYQLLFVSYQFDLDEKCLKIITDILSISHGDIHQNKIQQIIHLLKGNIESILPNHIELPQNEGSHISYLVH